MAGRVKGWACGAAVLSILLARPGTVRGHDLWVDETPAGYQLRYGHLPGAHEGAVEIPYDPRTVLRADCFDRAGRPGAATIERAYPVTIHGECAVLFVLTSSGCWTRTPYGTRNTRRSETEQVVDSWRSFESVKWLAAWSPALARPLTGDFEITPLADPFSLQDGDKLRLLVTRSGQAAAGAIVSYDGKPRGVTDASGSINVRIRHGAVQHVTASLRVPVVTPEADAEIHATCLRFRLGGNP
jgi:nickel transport protein